VLADEQGLGKTVQLLAAAPAGSRGLVVCPAIAIEVWVEHLQKVTPFRPLVLKGRKGWKGMVEAKRDWQPGEFIVMNYAILPSPAHVVGGPLPDLVIADEAHYLKGYDKRRTIRFRSLAHSVLDRGGRVWLSTGTPIKNTPEDLWSLAKILRVDGLFGPWSNFMHVFGGVKGAFGQVRWGGSIDAQVPALMKEFMLRREKANVLPQLPARRWDTVRVSIPGPARALCDKVVRDLKRRGVSLENLTADALENSDIIDFETMARVCRSLAVAKIPAALAMAEAHEGERPLLLWSRHRDPVLAAGKLPGWAAITGDTVQQERADFQRRFQDGELKGLAITIKAGGTALTLTRSDRAIFVDREWSPADNAQAEDRIHRLGQHRAVSYTTLVADHVLDERLQEILGSKGRIIAATVGRITER
jgi:SWI/SNF-related matrix-associated actin-dependent regulator 1 of chromatin subfamily A